MTGFIVRLAAAQALDTIATSEALVSKVIRTLDLQTDGAKLGTELRAQATQMRATAGDYLPDGTPFGVDIIDFRPETWVTFGPELAEPEVC
jgi:hypothetical protein